MSFPLRSPRDTTSGLVFFPRLVDKIRLHTAGKLPDGYHIGVQEGNRTFDDRFCNFVGLDFATVQRRILEGGSEEEMLEWCYDHGRRPNAEQIEVWNAFLAKRGWRDNGSAGLSESKKAAGFSDRDDIQTWFDLIDAEEGRRPA